ncbi:sensor histidine kinase [Candidatus Enterococcus clewellii]|uniref:histidine kinase n=1 Tax=Candidatus Enterococcus clewellii TaxID=1834193 RepID=A0A242K6G7_9ENTE|nr:HAMP domain-containing sensor histidine kinase [Enterococcus sp. 9E7_DIV0242]OTP15703.1 hypothetical protein A5888_001917 [Enterococcus sp. 9E7_DIV0242]
MHKISGFKSVIFIYTISIILLIAATLSIAWYVTHLTTIVRPDGQSSTSNWPQQYTESFIDNITVEKGIPVISEQGRASLRRNQLWIQLLDSEGNQIIQYDKPTDAMDSYSFSELLTVQKTNRVAEHTAFIMPMTVDGDDLTYIIGFPVNLSKRTMYFNSDSYGGMRSSIFALLIGVVIFVLIAGLIYGVWLTKHLSKIVVSSREIATRSYSSIKETGVFSDAYSSLNQLDIEIQKSDAFREKADAMKQEWIANITHDLKTPLSPIKGYAELLTDGFSTNSEEDIVRYGENIVNNVLSTERLINDLKLVYQMESGAVPLNMQQIDLSSEVRETIIDLLNQPKFADRSIEYRCEDAPVKITVDPMLIKRTIENIIINALIHNPVETEIIVVLEVADEITLSIKDNGKGISDEEMKKVFDRYYRGNHNDEKPEGSGLGLAIAKQVIELHNGKIAIRSTSDEGTTILIHLPKKAEEN